jgi:hypothetical protein
MFGQSVTNQKGCTMALGAKESYCGKRHFSIEDAIVHAEQHLGSYRKPADPYMGTLKNNSHLVVGFQLSARKRWRLDFDPDPSKGKWVHINEENFEAPPSQQKIVHLVEGQRNDTQVLLYYRKWTSMY